MNKKIIIFFLFLLPKLIVSKPEKAICIVPVADLLSEKIQPNKKRTILEAYKNIPASLTTKKGASSSNTNEYTRVLQLLYNEKVTILAQKNEQSYIETRYWNLTPLNKKNNRFWTLTSNLKPINLLNSNGKEIIPPIEGDLQTKSLLDVYILKDFFYCPETNLTYSAGTRFIKIRGISPFTTLIYDPKVKNLITCHIPDELLMKEHFFMIPPSKSPQYKRNEFLRIVHECAQSSEKVIPYVLGGGSIGERLSKNNFTIQKNTQQYADLYTLASYPYYPYQGLDSCGLVRYACTMAHMPIYTINSSSIASTLEKLSPEDYPENGDLIYWKGHIAVISNIQKGLLIEARSYDHGYGFVHEIPFNQELEGINTTDDLVIAYRKKTKINRLDKTGKKREVISDLMILKLPVSNKPNNLVYPKKLSLNDRK